MVGGLPRRQLRGVFWHQGSTRHGLTSFADPAISEGRYHRAGGPGVWYASDQEQAAWAELFRHFLQPEVDPFEVRRRIGKVEVSDLEIVDLTDTRVRAALGLEVAYLDGDDYTKTQAVALAGAAAGIGGMLAPSAALPGQRTLVVFASAWPMSGQGVHESPCRHPALADLLHAIRPHRDVPAGVRAYLEVLAAAGSQAVRRLRRSQ